MGKLQFKDNRFCFTPDGDIKFERITAMRAGLVADADDLRWFTRNVHKAFSLRRFADESAEKIFKKTFITSLETPEQILYPDHLHPRLFQIESAQHALTRTPAYVADEAGLGKTITSCLCMNTVVGKTLVICPPFLKYNWADEVQKWKTDKWRSVSVIENGAPRESEFQAGIIILPDSLIGVPAIQNHIARYSFEWLFVDEAHRYKSGNTLRTLSLIGDENGKQQFTYTSRANRVVYLSGTPFPNGKPIELYPLLSRTAHESIAWRNETAFGKTFCAGKLVTRYEGKRAIAVWDFSGSSNLKKLRRELRAKLMVRHLKREVLTELPPKTRKIVFLDNTKRLVAFEKGMLKSYTLEELLGGMMNMGQIAEYQRECGEAKLPMAVEYIRELLDHSPDKLVVFAHHIHVVEGLHAALKDYGALMIRGGMSPAKKQIAVGQFQNVKECRVIVGNMEAMGTGNTLTKAPGVVVVEPSWVPGVNEQAEDRVHRMTQNENVYIRYLVLRGSLDEHKLRSVLTKEKHIKEVMG